MFTSADLMSLATACQTEPSSPDPTPPRLHSIWEITNWMLPMAPEHLRRVLAAHPELPQGQLGAEGSTRRFSSADVAVLRAHFARGVRGARYQPKPGTAAPLIAMAQPLGRAGRSTSLLHLATAAALSGRSVLVIDADPSGQLASALGALIPPQAGLLSLLAKSAGQYLRASNEARLDRGDAPLPMPDRMAAAIETPATAMISPSHWPGLDVLPAPPALLQADAEIAGWQMGLRNWRPWRALTELLATEGLRQSYDLIFLDPGRGLGPLAISGLAAADVLLAPLPLATGLGPLGAGLAGLATAMTSLQAEEQMVQRALGRSAASQGWQQLMILPTMAAADAPALLAGFAARLGPVLLPDALPEIPQVAAGRLRQLYDLDYRDIGRLAYAPLREACEAAWGGVAKRLAVQIP